MQKKITYIILLFIGFFSGFKACDFINHLKYQTEIQEFRNTKTAECLVKQRKEELTVN
jgi:hypothetical protein